LIYGGRDGNRNIENLFGFFDYMFTNVDFLAWTHEPDQLTFLNRIESGEERIISVDVDGNTELLYSAGMEPIEIGPPAWFHDGRIAYQVNTRIHTYLDISDDNLNELWIDHKPFISAFKDKDNPCNNRFFVRSNPSWSPDGKNLVVSVTNRRVYSALWNVNTADGSYSIIFEKEVETDETGLFYNPSYSPDGNSIAFSAFMPGDDAHKIWIINSDGSGLRSPANLEGRNPAWSPDGRYLIYGSTRYGLFEFGNPIKYSTGLYLVLAEGGEPILMTPNNMGAWWATWRP